MPKIFASPTPDETAQEREHAALARAVAGDCIVLLKNDGTLPLAPGPVALMGTGARRTVKGGTGSGDVYSRSSVSVERGLEQAGFTVATRDWLDRYDEKYLAASGAYLDFLKKKAREEGCSLIVAQLKYPFEKVPPVEVTKADLPCGADTAIYVIARDSGEGADRRCERGDYLLFQEEIENLRTLGENGKRVVVVLNVGAVLDVSELLDIPGIGAIVMMGQLGNIGGLALADMLTGRVTPSGKLTDTWAKRYEDYPSSATFSANDGNVDDEPYAEGVYVGYRYFSSFDVEPVYPFGYGLSYASFGLRATGASLREDGHTVEVTVEAVNTHEHFSGREVAQLYVSAPQEGIDKPERVLAAYAKTRLLAPGERETLTLSFSVRDVASYSEALAALVLDAGRYTLRLGANARDTQAVASLTLGETVVVRQLSRLSGIAPAQADIAPQKRDQPVEPVPFELALEPIRLVQVPYAPVKARAVMATDKKQKLTMDDVRAGRADVEELTAQLTVAEMAELCVGTLRVNGDSAIVGNASCIVPGAAGDTSALLEQERGVRPLILADGPAGLRLTPHFAVTAGGTIVPDPQKAAPEDSHYYQYCTAIPIGWSLAQSWDSALLEAVGDMVGREMERFGVDLWLAPALNIHRNPLCGRNFEYFSEDPLISGHAAAAISRGVQRHPGCGVTIKHYAANNQEDNRYFSNSIVSERALREIYMKGFEIAIREGKPLSVMTSYNLICGLHAANHRPLLETVLRGEWGFDGFVMTDWFTSQDVPQFTGVSDKYPIASSVGCIFAGNDVQMPGCQKNVDDIVRAVETEEAVDGYTITLADLQAAAANLLRVIARLG